MITLPLKVEDFKYLGKNVTNQINIQEEIRRRQKTWNACSH